MPRADSPCLWKSLSLFCAALELMGSHVQRCRPFDSSFVSDRDQTLIEHRVIIEALSTRSLEAAG